MTTLFIDLETFSEVPIAYGTHAYAKKAEILLFAYALDDGPVSVWDATTGEPTPAVLAAALADQNVLLCAHNAAFDRTVLRHTGYDLPIYRWRDTMVKALAHSLPGALGDLCAVLKVPTDLAKEKEGRQLVNLFCKPRPVNSKLRRATRETHPKDWANFIRYAALDIEAMREVNKRLPEWNYRAFELDLWHLDQAINDRGFQVDTELAHAAIRAVEQAKKLYAAETVDMTDGKVQSATQRDALLCHINETYDVDLPDLRSATIERYLNRTTLPVPVRELLTIRAQASSTSTSKYKTLINAVSGDGRLRGTLQFNGASRTGRWAGRLFQPQNIPRGAITDHEELERGIAALKADRATENVIALTSSALRGCIIAPPGKKLVVADLSNIEGRVLAWLAGEEWKLKAFRDFDAGRGHDLYKLAYAKSFGVAPEAVTKEQRQIGKVLELAMGYGGGVGAFITFAAAYGIDLDTMAEQAFGTLPPALLAQARNALQWTKQEKRSTYGLSERTWLVCESFKRAWRDSHPMICSFWMELAAITSSAMFTPGVTHSASLSASIKARHDRGWLRLGLPSGRVLCYPAPRIDEEGTLSYLGVSTYSRKWSRLTTYGGKLAENATQAVSRDVLAANMPAIEAAGYQIVLSVHDELITETPDSPGFNAEQLASLMASNPPWAEGLPLAAEGFETKRYRKQ